MSPSLHPSAKKQFLGALLGMSIAVLSYTAFNVSFSLNTVRGYLASDLPATDNALDVRTNRVDVDPSTERTLQRNAQKVASFLQSSSSSVSSDDIHQSSSSPDDALHAAAPLSSSTSSAPYNRLALRTERLQSIQEHSGAPGYKPLSDPISPEEQWKGKGKGKGIPQPIPAPIIPTPERTVVREVRVPVDTPPRVVTREIKVPTPQKTIIREVKVPVSTPPKVIIKEVPVPSSEPIEHLTDSGMGLNIALVLSLFGAFFLIRADRKEEWTSL